MAWTKYKTVKLAAGGIPSANLTDFPKLVSITTDADIAAELSGGGGIKFTSADGVTDLSFGLYPSTNLAAGTILARFKAGSLLTAASVGDVIARLYYSSTGSTTENKAGVMDGNYAIFMPLEEDPSGSAPQMRDWVADTLLGTSNGSMASGALVSTQVGKGLEFDGSDDYVNVPSDAAFDSSFGTWSGWFKTSQSVAGGYPLIVARAEANSQQGVSLFLEQSTGKLYCQIYKVGGTVINHKSSTTGLNDGNWHHFAITFSHAAFDPFTLVLDGAQEVSTTLGDNWAFNSQAVRIGIAADNFWQKWAGDLDEFSISTVVRAPEWIAYSYADDFTNSSTFTLSAEQGAGASTNTEFGLGRVDIPHPFVGPMALRQKWRPQPIQDYTRTPSVDREYGVWRVNPPSPHVGPTALRQGWRQPPPFNGTQAAATNTEFGTRTILPHNRVGPMALRQRARRSTYPFDSTASAASATNRIRRLICSGA